MFGVKKSGFVFPLRMRLRLDPATNVDFGVSGFFQSIDNTGQEYIVFELGGRICNISEKLYNKCFAKCLGGGDQVGRMT